MEKKVKTRKERSKLVDIIINIWKKLTDPEKDDEFEEVNREDTGKFKKYLRDIQIKTGTIKKDENLTKSSKYKIKGQNIRGERKSYTQGREERDWK